MTRDVEELGSRVPSSAKAGKPFSTPSANIRSDGNGLNISNRGWAPEDAHVSRKWGL